MRLQYRPILDLAIIPAVVFLLLSFVSVVLTTHYWILGDYFIPRGVKIPLSTINERTKRPETDDTIVYFLDRVTDATISSGVLCLSAAVMSIIAWSTLRKPDMDSQYSAGKRRFYIIAVVVLTMTGAVTALASLILHFTKMGSNEFGCNSERLMMAGKLNSNQYCTREMAACNFQPRYLKGSDKSISAIACNEIITVKWLQILLILNAAIVFAFFALQARIRRTTREVRSVHVPKDL